MADPKLRFPEYNDEWKSIKLGDILIESKEYGKISTGYPLLTSARTGLMYQNEFRESASTDNEDALFSIVKKGYCTYRHMSDDNIFHFNINQLCDVGLVSKEYPVFSTNELADLYVLVEYLNASQAFLEFCKAQKKGGTRTRLYLKNLFEFEMKLPSIKEQQKIAGFLSNIDEVISTSEDEVKNLELQKKGVMQKIFSQEVRFKKPDESDFEDWNLDLCFKDCFNIISGVGFKASEYVDDGLPLLQIENVSYGFCKWENPIYVPYDYMDKYPDLILQEDDIVLALNRPITNGRLKIAEITDKDCQTVLYQRVGKITCHDINTKFAFQMLERLIFDFVIETSVGSDQPFISTNKLKEMNIIVPSLEEQQLIADFLSSFDEAITAAKQELEKWKELKKGLLQQMFV